MRRLSLCFILMCVLSFAAVSASPASSHRKSRSRAHGLSAPNLLEPSYGQEVQQISPLTWSAVAGASEYEYQFAADPHFNSVLMHSTRGRRGVTTHNLAGTLEKPVTDGIYYWRVRGLTKAKEAGPWSSTRRIVKAWNQAPRLLEPAPGADIAWPSTPLVLRWTPVASATQYIVTISSDPRLSNTVVGSTASPTKTWASVFALPGTLPEGRYYWAITPVDTLGHRGARSAVHSFNWSWPTLTTTQVSDLNDDPRVFEPRFSWAPIPGAARYEVQVNSAEGFPAGSMWCCEHEPATLGTSLTPIHVLANNEYYWRVRAIDASGNAGVWNEGSRFTKAFDAVTPSIENLTMTDVHGSALPTGTTTDTPIVTWSPVPGASKYEVWITPWVSKVGCDLKPGATTLTSTVAWTPKDTVGENAPHCVLVRAYSDHDAFSGAVYSDWTQLGDAEKPAFTFANQPPPGEPGPDGLETQESDYILPAPGSTTPRTPLFTWNRVPGASEYKVVIVRDWKPGEGFTKVVAEAMTTVPAYAPPLGGEMPLDDETTSYYWAVEPVNSKGQIFATPPLHDFPQAFNKSSVPPTPFEPIAGFDLESQPTFTWSPAEGAVNYSLQVSRDPSFGNLIDNVRTDSTSYTSSSTYPADATLYWRVRANDANSHQDHEGLNWSPVQTFRRALPMPVPSADNATSGQDIPVLSWSAVPGATGYEVHGEQPDGTTKDFTLNSTAFTVSEWDGPGIWRWQARAKFPTTGSGATPGPYFAPQPLAHTMAAPSNAIGTKAGARMVIKWSPAPYAKEYDVEISTTDTFSSTLGSKRIDQASWAPDVNLSVPANRHTLFWRVAGIDNKGNIGPFAEGRFVAPRRHCTTKRVKRGRHTVRVCVSRARHRHR
jgi:hypothetical protein